MSLPPDTIRGATAQGRCRPARRRTGGGDLPPNPGMMALSMMSRFLPSAPVVAVELVRMRKLMALQASGRMNLGAGKLPVGLLTSFVLAALLCGAGVVCICVLGWMLFRRRKPVTALEFNEQAVVNSLRDDNVIGTIGRGDRLYRVDLQDSGIGRGCLSSRTVTVKKLENEIGDVDADLKSRCRSEVNMLGVIRHDNIINLLQCIQRDDMILLLYDHMENGSLGEWLPHRLAGGEAGERRRPPLPWPARLAIATDVARGLCHLHHECNRPIVHRNITQSSILLDGDLKAKIAGFDFARINLAGLNQPFPNSEIPADALGYTAPEYSTALVNEKVDVYSFGVLLLQLVTGRPANVPGVVDGHLATWAHGRRTLMDDADMHIPDRVQHLKDMAAVFRLGVDCTVKEPWLRPSMQMVVDRLCRRGWRLWGLGPCFT
ncbi:hypothetical protein ACP4OV_002435 [Aristida adscensionis]